MNPADTPIFQILSDQVAAEIASLPRGAAVASEHELATRFAVNRLTARAALQELERRGLVRRFKGRGTVVARKIEYLIGQDWVPSWTRTVAASGAVPRTVTDTVAVRKPRPEEQEELLLGSGERVVQLDRLRLCDGENAGFQTSVLPAPRVPGIKAKLGEGGSVYESLVRDYGFDPVRVWSRIEHLDAPDWVARRLGLRGRPPLVLVRGRLDCAATAVPLELTHAWLRADMFDVVVEVGRWRRLPATSPLREVEVS